MLESNYQKPERVFQGIFWGKEGGKPELKETQKEAWFAAFNSQPKEFSYQVTEIEGSLPKDLFGSTLFRNTPGLFERGNTRVNHYLDGDGYIYKIAFSPAGNVYFQSKFVQTEEYLKEAKHDCFLYRSTFGTQKPGGWLNNIFDINLKNPANTNIISWGGKLLALYEAGLPYAIDPYTLKTIKPETLNGFLKAGIPVSTGNLAIDKMLNAGKPMTAHPHIDPIQNRLITWSWYGKIQLGKPDELVIDIVEFDRDWQIKKNTTHSLIETSINPHDFAVTESYYIFFENQLGFDSFPYLLGLEGPATCLNFKEDKPTKIHLISRSNPNLKPIILETIPWFAIHQVFARDTENGGVEIYSTGWPGSGLTGKFLDSWGGYAPDFDNIAPTYLWKTSIDIDRAKIEHKIVESMENHCIDHPHINPALETQNARYIYMTFSNKIGHSSPPNGYMKLDLKTGKKQYWCNDDLCFSEEPLFVAKPEAIAEDDGYILGTIYEHTSDRRSSLVILDAKNLDSGPICRLLLKHHLPHSLHGSWCGEYYSVK